MASVYSPISPPRDAVRAALADPALAIGGPRLDALCFWGSPLIALVFTMVWVGASTALPPAIGPIAGSALVGAVAVLTYAHLIAVVPRAYFNREVFAAYRLRLTIVPVLLIAALFASHTLLVCGIVLAVFWDVHHSALQTFGLARIYDMKAGNDAHRLRRVDLLLNWALYVGPLGFGASLLVHLREFERFGALGWGMLTQLPEAAEGLGGWIRLGSLAAWAVVVAAAAIEYRRAAAQGYRMPVHKAALLGSTALVSILAWGFAPPVIAFLAINLFHAVQYFALVWLKEGPRMAGRMAPHPRNGWRAAALFAAFCIAFGIAYRLADATPALLTPFIACSLLHFWYDSFVWSVRKKQV